jgi:FtsZ-interacting cell division protein ZipA
MEVAMDPKVVMAIIIVVAIVAVLIIALLVVRKQRSAKLRQRFGTEYDRTVHEIGQNKAESVLLEREKRVEKFSLRVLSAEERERFISEWRIVQSNFVDDPRRAVGQADLLVDRVMQARGYPMADFEQRAADISVDHPAVVSNYRAARVIAARHRQGQATTEDLRQAMIHYRSLFDELLETSTTTTVVKKEVA